jgi:hypothetical protein
MKIRPEKEKKDEPLTIEMIPPPTESHDHDHLVVSDTATRHHHHHAPDTLVDNHIIHESRPTDGVANDIDHDTEAIHFPTLEVDASDHGSNVPSRQTSLSFRDEDAFHAIHQRSLGLHPPSSDDESGSGSGSGSGEESDSGDEHKVGAPVRVGTVAAPPPQRQPSQRSGSSSGATTSASDAARANGPSYGITGGAGTRVVSSVGTGAIVGAIDELLR